MFKLLVEFDGDEESCVVICCVYWFEGVLVVGFEVRLIVWLLVMIWIRCGWLVKMGCLNWILDNVE